jgi:hypothetical protein
MKGVKNVECVSIGYFRDDGDSNAIIGNLKQGNVDVWR